MVVKIGHVGPTSGAIAHLGKDNENGARMAIEELNAQGVTIGGKKIRPGLLRGLVSIKRPGGPPLLGIRMRVTDQRLAQKITASMLLRGPSSKRGKMRVIPLFVGVPRVTIAKKWSVYAAARKAYGRMPGIYTKLLGAG